LAGLLSKYAKVVSKFAKCAPLDTQKRAIRIILLNFASPNSKAVFKTMTKVEV
jgi:hypothetical protein